MNQLPSDIINNILIIQYDERIRELKMKLSKVHDILIKGDYCCCECCDDWFLFNELSITVEGDHICDDCQIDNDFLPCCGCGNLDYVENMFQTVEDDCCYDYCEECRYG